jgi:hypothetical protein
MNSQPSICMHVHAGVVKNFGLFLAFSIDVTGKLMFGYLVCMDEISSPHSVDKARKVKSRIGFVLPAFVVPAIYWFLQGIWSWQGSEIWTDRISYYRVVIS